MRTSGKAALPDGPAGRHARCRRPLWLVTVMRGVVAPLWLVRPRASGPHVVIASARSAVRFAEVRGRWTLNVLWMAACVPGGALPREGQGLSCGPREALHRTEYIPRVDGRRYAPSLPQRFETGMNARLATPSRERSFAMNEHERPVVTAANKEAVRAGHTGDHLRYVLIGSCALAILGLILVALLVKP
jgi:hypothetical protein